MKETAFLELNFFMDKYNLILDSCIGSLVKIWSNPFNLMKLWCIKYAEEPEKARVVDSSKDSYDRIDNYDGQGIAIWVYICLKE